MAGLVNDATLARIAAEPDRPLSMAAGLRPGGRRPGRRPVRRAGGGPVGGSDAQRGLCGIGGDHRPSLRGPDAGGGVWTRRHESDRRGPPSVDAATAGPIFGAVGGGYTVLIEELVGAGAIALGAGPRSTASTATGTAGRCVDDAGARLARRRGDPRRSARGSVAACWSRSRSAHRGAAGRIDSASSVVLAIAVPRDTAFPQCSGVLVASGERLRAKAITLSSRKWGSARRDAQLLRLSFGRFGDRPGDAAHPTTSCWPGRSRTWPPFSV